MSTILSIVLSVLALGFSAYVFIDSRSRDRRDMVLKIHEYLSSDELQRGRYLLFEKISDGASVDGLSGDEYRHINRALGAYNAIGAYVKNGYVSTSDVMQLWAVPVHRAWRVAQPFVAHRQEHHGYHPWIYFEFLAQQAEKEITKMGVSLDVKVERRLAEPE